MSDITNRIAARLRSELEKNSNVIPAFVVRDALIEIERLVAVNAAHQEAASEFYHLATVRQNEIGRLEAIVELSCNLASRARSCAAFIQEQRENFEDKLVGAETLDKVVRDLREVDQAWTAQRALVRP